MTSPRILCLTGARGGSGTSTVAAALALLAARQHPTELVAHHRDDMVALLGLSTSSDPDAAMSVTPQLALRATAGPGSAALVVIDAGSQPDGPELPVGAEHYLVVRGPCYLALRAIVRGDPSRYDGVILVTEPGRSLRAADVAEVLDLPVVAEVPQHPAVARSIDAGLLAARIDRLKPLTALRTLTLEPPRRSTPRRPPAAVPTENAASPISHHPSERTSEESSTDWPCPLFSGHGGRRPGRGTRIGVARGRTDLPIRRHHRAQHRQASTRRRRLLHRRDREVAGGLLPRPR